MKFKYTWLKTEEEGLQNIYRLKNEFNLKNEDLKISNHFKLDCKLWDKNIWFGQ